MYGRRCLITGASQGLGYALSHKLALMGASVTLVARNEDKLIRNLETLPTSETQSHSIVPYDLNNLLPDMAQESNKNYLKLVDSLKEISVLINCAGITTHSLLPKLKPATIASTINLNLTAPILLSQLSYRHMLKKRTANKPVIVNISSVLSCTGTTLPGTAVYAALKAGLVGFTTSLATEMRGKVRVNAILPGLISETSMGAEVNRDLGLSQVSLEDVTDATVDTILNEELNGECIIVDQDGQRLFKFK